MCQQPCRRSTAVQVTEYGIEKRPRRGKAAAHSTVHSTAARSTAQIIKAAKALSIVSLLNRTFARTIPGHPSCITFSSSSSSRAAAAAAAAASWRDHLGGRTTKCRLPARASRAVGRTISPARHDCVARGDPGQAFENRLGYAAFILLMLLHLPLHLHLPLLSNGISSLQVIWSRNMHQPSAASSRHLRPCA